MVDERRQNGNLAKRGKKRVKYFKHIMLKKISVLIDMIEFELRIFLAVKTILELQRTFKKKNWPNWSRRC